MRTIFAFAFALSLCVPAFAQSTRDGDAPFEAQSLANALSGQTLEFFDGSLARYGADTGYEYRYKPEEPPFVGSWSTNEDSEVCVTFENGFSRCDVIVQAAGRLVLITKDGLRFPVRTVLPNS